MVAIKLLEKKVHIKEQQCADLHERNEKLRKEFTELLNEKDAQDSVVAKLRIDLDSVEQGYLNLKAGSLRQNDKLANIIGVQDQLPLSDLVLERAVKDLVQLKKDQAQSLETLRTELANSEKERLDEAKSAALKYTNLD